MQRLTQNMALVVVAASGLLVALASVAMPVDLLEDIVWRSGIAAFVPAAEAPLGMTARICVGVFAGALVALVLWFVLSAVIALREAREAQRPTGPTIRRADAHPDARPREPLRARDLDDRLADGNADSVLAVPVPSDDFGSSLLFDLPREPAIAMGPPSPAQPMPDDQPEAPAAGSDADSPDIGDRFDAPPSVQPLPADLDQPLAAYDPNAIPAEPKVPPPPVMPLHRPSPPPIYDAGERFETFELTPAVRPAHPIAPVLPDDPQAIATPATASSVHALLDRLERGIARRAEQPASETGSQPKPELDTEIQSEPEPEPEPEPAPKPEPASQPELAQVRGSGLESALAQLRRMATRV